MQAAVITAPGQPPRYAPFPDPQPQEGEAIVHVRAAGLHPVVKALAAGSHYASSGDFPMIPGLDGVGVLETGDRVYFGFARRPWGTMCERTVVPQDKCLPLPDGISDAVAAALPNAGMSGWLALKERAAVQPGETVLICGATGIAGRMAVQAARHLGAARIIGTGRRVDSLANAGLDAIIDLTQPDDAIREALQAETRSGIDVVIDYLWGRPTELLLEALASTFNPGGSRPIRFVELGDTAGKTITLAGAALRSVDLRLIGGGLGSVSIQRVWESIPDLFALAARGELTVNIDPTPLSEVEAAWNRPAHGRRIVLITG